MNKGEQPSLSALFYFSAIYRAVTASGARRQL